ncbi:MAG: excisionase family DNA-binding protein [Eggerthellaceae bacterium]|nr:excisionase family DNA-binding protein [Eggerthellaceae bacterium]
MEIDDKIQLKKNAEGKVITLHEAAELLHTSNSTLYRLVIDGELPAISLRNSWRSSDKAFEGYVEKLFAEQAATCKSQERK